MPAPAGSDAKKAGKVSKKQQLAQEQQRLLSEAQKAEEAELQRQAAEERKAREEENARSYAQQQQKNAETERLLQQARRDHHYLQRQQQLVQHLHASLSQQEEWDKYLQCNPLPDVTREAELNTFLSLWRDAPAASSSPHSLLQPVVNSCSVSESIVQSLSDAASAAREEHDQQLQSFLSHYASTLRELIVSKLDSLTSAFLSHSEQYEDESRTFSVSHHSQHLDFALWVHGSAKHGRVKRIDWPDVDISVELPVALQQSRIAIRCCRTSYDHLSARDDIDRTADAAAGAEAARGAAGDKEAAAAAAGLGGAGSEARRPQRPPHHFISVGGLICIEQLSLPPPPKQAKGWAMRELLHTFAPLQQIPYPNDDAATVSAPSAVPAAATAASAATATAASSATSQSNAPLRLSFRIPPSVYLPSSSPRFGWYDAATAGWRQDGITLLSFDPATRQTQLSLSTLRPIALIQPRALDFPYRQWLLQSAPAAPLSSHLLVKGSRYDTTVAVQGGLCSLLTPSHPLLQSVNSASLPPGRLLTRMQQLGINVLPTAADGDYCRKPDKRAELLEALHGHVAGVIGAFDLSGMEMNSGRGEGCVMMRVRLCRDGDEVRGSVEKRRRWEERREEEAWWKEEKEQEEREERERRSNLQQQEEEKTRDDAKQAGDGSDADDDDLSPPPADEQKTKEEEERKRKAEQEEKTRAEKEEKEKKTAESAASTADTETQQQRAVRAYAWQTVMVTLTDIDGTLITPSSSSSSSSAAAAAPLPFGCIPEHIPGGHHLLRFLLVSGCSNGQLDLTPLPGAQPHVSLRRCLYYGWKELLEPAEVDIAAALDLTEEASGLLRFLPVEAARLHHQQTVRKLLNLANVFRFF